MPWNKRRQARKKLPVDVDYFKKAVYNLNGILNGSVVVEQDFSEFIKKHYKPQDNGIGVSCVDVMNRRFIFRKISQKEYWDLMERARLEIMDSFFIFLAVCEMCLMVPQEHIRDMKDLNMKEYSEIVPALARAIVHESKVLPMYNLSMN